ncbi:MAG: GNAT family N-acetyltransferase, partial [Bacteroidia bacterium]|nr:GNAT family N-acetyltransferase [Bacteroidia bacterium]
LHAQETAVLFYQKLGFYSVGEPFDEAGIIHYRMYLDLELFQR